LLVSPRVVGIVGRSSKRLKLPEKDEGWRVRQGYQNFTERLMG